jgi:hypothetical protein
MTYRCGLKVRVIEMKSIGTGGKKFLQMAHDGCGKSEEMLRGRLHISTYKVYQTP